MNPTLRIAFIAAVLATLAGCGNKGPLVMPPKPAPIDPASVPATDADAQTGQAAEDPAPTTGEESAPSPPPVEPPPADGTPEIPPATPADGGNGHR